MNNKIIAALVLTLSASPAVLVAAENQIKHHVYAVAATNDEWTPTEIKVQPGDIVFVNESGNQIVVGGYLGKTGADGLNNGVGALNMKIGVGAGFKIGSSGHVIATEQGVVKFRVHDTKYADNSGSYSVDVIYIPASAIPSAIVIEQQ